MYYAFMAIPTCGADAPVIYIKSAALESVWERGKRAISRPQFLCTDLSRPDVFTPYIVKLLPIQEKNEITLFLFLLFVKIYLLQLICAQI